VRLEIFVAMKVKVMVFLVMTLCSNVVGYQHFGKQWCLHLKGKINMAGRSTNIGRKYKSG
jgi:hypothetical protein